MAEPDRTNADAERVSDIVAKLRVLAGLQEYLEDEATADEAADIIEAQSKALAEAKAIAVRMREITQDVWDKREGYTDRQAWSDLHGQAMQLLGWEVKSRLLTPTPENPNG